MPCLRGMLRNLIKAAETVPDTIQRLKCLSGMVEIPRLQAKQGSAKWARATSQGFLRHFWRRACLCDARRQTQTGPVIRPKGELRIVGVMVAGASYPQDHPVEWANIGLRILKC